MTDNRCVYCVTDVERATGPKKLWVRCGSAKVNESTGEITVDLWAMPLTGKLVIPRRSLGIDFLTKARKP